MGTDEEPLDAEKRKEEEREEDTEPASPPPARAMPAHLANPTPASQSRLSPTPEPAMAKAGESAVLAPPSPTGKTPTFGTGTPVPLSQLDQLGRPKVDKYFGSKLPPVCRQLGCYVTDDGKFYYCINPHCHKDRKRETKYNRRKRSLVYFFCPKCKSREIQLHLRKNHYECLECAYSWKN